MNYVCGYLFLGRGLGQDTSCKIQDTSCKIQVKSYKEKEVIITGHLY